MLCWLQIGPCTLHTYDKAVDRVVETVEHFLHINPSMFFSLLSAGSLLLNFNHSNHTLMLHSLLATRCGEYTRGRERDFVPYRFYT